MHLCLRILLFICLIMGHSAFAENCPMPMELYDQLQAIKDVEDQNTESPFLVACKEPPGLLKNRPKTGVTIRS